MNKIEKYLDSVYCDFNLRDKELQELKNEMRNHIEEAVKDLKEQGHTEEESIDIAIKNFGDLKELDSEISDVFEYRNKDYKFISIAIIIFMLSLIVLTKLLSNGGTYTRVIFPLILIPVYIVYKAITIWNYNKRYITINIRHEYLKILTTLFIILSFNYLIFPLDIKPGFMKLPFFFVMPDNTSHILLRIVNIMIAFIPYGLFMKLNSKSENTLKKILLYSIFVFIAYCGIKILLSLLGIENIAIRCFEVVGVIIGTSIGYLLHKIIVKK